MTVTPGSDNVFEDLGFEAEEATNLKVQADLMLKLQQYITESGWTQEQVSEFFGETRPQVSHLMNGEISCFNVDELINMLGKAGMQIKVEILPKVA